MANKYIGRGGNDVGRSGSQASTSSSVHRAQLDQFNEPRQVSPQTHNLVRSDSPDELRRRPSHISMIASSFTQAGGPNSMENFARSWQRAVGFREIMLSRTSSVVDEDQGESESRRLLGGEFGSYAERSSPHRAGRLGNGTSGVRIYESHGTAFWDTPRASRLSPNLDATYGSTSSHWSSGDRENGSRSPLDPRDFAGRQSVAERKASLITNDELENIKFESTGYGQSTLSQTIFNSTNVLIGSGLLSLPLGVYYAGWVIGLLFMAACAVVTAYTARLLGKCLDTDLNLMTFLDLAYAAFGPKSQIIIGIMFNLELLAACVALFVLFADSLELLIPEWGLVELKITCGAVIMFPMSFVPLRILSYSSSLGILSCSLVVLLVMLDGFIKQEAPGSLIEPATTRLFPDCWTTIPLALGLFMSPWGGHSVFPSIYRDMRHPKKYSKALRITYGFTYLIENGIGIVGLLMYGEETREEITSNILTTEGYPRVISSLIIACIALISLSKIPLTAFPMISTAEQICGIKSNEIIHTYSSSWKSKLSKSFFKIVLHAITTVVVVLIAIICPSFDRIMALMGSFFGFIICVVLPVGFYLKLCGKDVSFKEKILGWFLIVTCFFFAIIGTVWVFLPKELTGAR